MNNHIDEIQLGYYEANQETKDRVAKLFGDNQKDSENG